MSEVQTNTIVASITTPSQDYVNYPIFAGTTGADKRWSTPGIILLGGGGGSVKSGVKNTITVCNVVPTKSSDVEAEKEEVVYDDQLSHGVCLPRVNVIELLLTLFRKMTCCAFCSNSHSNRTPNRALL